MQFGTHRALRVEELALPKVQKGRITTGELEAQPSLRSCIVAVWRDALSTFSAQSPAILMISLAGFWGVALIGAWVTMMLQLDFDGRASTLLDLLSDEHRLRALLAVHETKLNQVVMIQAFAGMIAISFARGVITSLALHGSQPSHDGERSVRIRQAMRVTFERYPTLLIGSLLYGVLITIGIVVTSGLTKALEFVPSQFAPASVEPPHAFHQGLRQLLWRGLNTSLPDPGPPFAEFIPDPQSTYMHGSRMIALAGIVLIFLAESLLRFRTVMVVKPPRSRRPRRFGWLTPLFANVRFGLRHFGEITVHIWLVRLAIFAVSLVFIELPTVLMDNVVALIVSGLGGALPVERFAVWPILEFMASAGATLAGAILLAFSMVYDARLYLALSGEAKLSRTICLVTMTAPLLVASCQSASATPAPMPTEAVNVAYAMNVYQERNCSSCHQLDEVNPEPRPGPTHNGMGATAESRIRDPTYGGVATTAAEYIRESIVNPSAYIAGSAGRTRLVMPAYANLEERELNALVQMLLQAR